MEGIEAVKAAFGAEKLRVVRRHRLEAIVLLATTTIAGAVVLMIGATRAGAQGSPTIDLTLNWQTLALFAGYLVMIGMQIERLFWLGRAVARIEKRLEAILLALAKAGITVEVQ